MGFGTQLVIFVNIKPVGRLASTVRVLRSLVAVFSVKRKQLFTCVV